MLGLPVADWIVIVVYLLLITAIGVATFRKVKDQTDFFMGGRRFGKVFMMFFAFGAGTSSEQAVGVAAGSFRFGLAGIWYQFLWLFVTPFYWIIAPIFRRMRALTVGDFFEARYDSSTATLYSLVGATMSITFIAAALYGGAQMVEGLAGGIDPATGEPFFPASYAIAMMTVMFVLYGLAGGLGAAVITDFIQGILTIIFSFLLLPFALYVAASVAGVESGFTALHAGVPGRDGDALLSMTLSETAARAMGQEPITAFYILMLSLSGLVGIVVQPHIMGVCGAGKTEFEGRFGFTVGNFIKRICTIAWTFTGLACVIIYLTPDNGYIGPEEFGGITGNADEMKDFADQVFGRAAHDILPTVMPGLVGLLFASLMAAIMSTCDAQMVVGSGLLTENLYRRYIRPNASDAHYLWVGRVSSLLIVALALLLLTQFDNVIQVLTAYVQPIPTFMGLSLWLGISWRGYTAKGVWASTLVSAAAWYLTLKHTPFELISNLGDSAIVQQNVDYVPSICRGWLAENAPFMMRVDAAGETVAVVARPWQYLMFLSAGLIAGVAVSLLTRRTDSAKLDRFFRLMRTPVRHGEVIDAPCTLPADAGEPIGKFINHPDIEIPKPTTADILGFAAAWCGVALVILFTYWLAS
jgi:Na+/proline symporter